MPVPVLQSVNSGLHGAATLSQGVFTKSKGFFQEFKDFISKGHAFDLAVAFILSTALSAVIKSLVEDIITPLFGFGNNRNLDEMFLVLRCGREVQSCKYPTRAVAQLDGAVTWNWGRFINTIIYLLLVGLFLFIIIKLYYVLRRKQQVKDKVCQFCMKDVNGAAVRCAFCSSWLDQDVRRKVDGDFAGNTGSGLSYSTMSNTTLGTQNGLMREKNSIDVLRDGTAVGTVAGVAAGTGAPMNQYSTNAIVPQSNVGASGMTSDSGLVADMDETDNAYSTGARSPRA
ncbi:hypothetical protein BGZ72_004993 [Mortierella alpina]|nr:hypothetical protein BGZ72_004993 [Mortierella alpina]